MTAQLAIDVGMHTGEDTRRFLDAGYRVVAVEANPELVQVAATTFAPAIDTGELTIVGAAIAQERGTVALGITDDTVWSSIDPEFIARNEREAGSVYRYVDVPALPFRDVLDEHGTPHYLKVDIEGLDMLCIRALAGRDELPMFVSIESNVTVNHARMDRVFDEIAQLWACGYRRFRYVEQEQAGNTVPDGERWDGPPWRTAWNALAFGQALRVHHNLSGMGGRWRMSLPGRTYSYARWRLGRKPTWYDLQAALPA